jgi:Spy/CpxP family protein refolding chaperone
VILAAGFILSGNVAKAQAVPADREALMKSAGSGMATYADRHGYPGPLHVMEMHDTLDLTEDQLRAIEAIYDEMKEKAREKGEIVVRKEEELNMMFASGTAQEASVLALSREIGTLRGELRAVHLAAHLQAALILSESQRALYHSLRYTARDPHRHENMTK